MYRMQDAFGSKFINLEHYIMIKLYMRDIGDQKSPSPQGWIHAVKSFVVVVIAVAAEL